MEDLNKEKRITIIETTPDKDSGIDNYTAFLESDYERLKNIMNNAFWFLEGKNSNLMLFHLFSNHKENEVEQVVCNFGSDIFDDIKLNTKVFSTGGYLIESNGKKIINPELNEFKKNISQKVLSLYQTKPNFNHYRLTEAKIHNAMNLEFASEANYQKIIDWIFENVGITTTLKYFINGLKDDAKDIQKYRFQEYNYLPYLSNFDPVFNDSFLQAFGINPTTLIENYTVSKEDLEYYNIPEKEVNWVFAFNAEFCGFWNALVDSFEGLFLLFPGLYEILTDRANIKKFVRLIIDVFENFSKLKDLIVQYDKENSSGSIYKLSYQHCYEITMLLTLLLPLPKAAQSVKSTSAYEFFSNALSKLSLKSELIFLAYRLGLRVERTADEWALISDKVILFKGTKEKVLKRIEHITEVAKKNPKFGMRNLSLGRLKDLVKVKKGEGAFLRGLTKEEQLVVQKKLSGANIAVAKFRVSYRRRVRIVELKAYSNKNISQLDKFDFCKPANLRSGEKVTQFEEITEKGLTRRFQDTESKIFRGFEDNHLKDVMNQLGAKSASDLKIEVELQTILDPCNVCQGQMKVFEAKYNAKIDIYSSGADKTKRLNELYPKLKIENP
ncbi:MAG: hypothetical protein AB7E26_01605 [Chryseobacterium sp.]